MIVNEISLLNKLLGSDDRRFVIPIYQRKYKWTAEQCNRLIADIIKSGEAGKEHFTGTIIYQEPNAGTFKTAYLVDGQQRITTVMLMIKALLLISSSEKETDNNYKYVYDKLSNFVYADKNDPARGLKLVPGKNDEKSFEVIMNGNNFDDISKYPLFVKCSENNLFNNFKTIYNKFLSFCTDGSKLRYVLLEGLLLLKIVEMSLDTSDDPQAIFESINSLGLKLSNADLIRNYLLMTNTKQKELYENYWEVIQDTYITESNMESFVFNYLMMKKAYAINSDDVYKEYVLFANDYFCLNEIDKEVLLKDLCYIAKIYQPFIRNTASYSTETNMLMQELRDMAQTTAYPFLMKVFLDFDNGLINENELDKVINLIIVYLVRRAICGVPTNSLRGFMLNLYNRVFKIKENKNRYYEAIYAFLSQLDTTDRLRTSFEMKEALKTAEIYKNVKFATYLLYKIENGRYPKVYSEFTLANSITVEHIIPQTLTNDWYDMLGEDADEIHRVYLNTLGNLSLSSRAKNSVMSNESFLTKRDILMSESSKFNELNKDIKKEQTIFDRNSLEEREKRLAEIVCSKYDLGAVNVEGIKFEDCIEIVCSTDYEDVFNFATPVYYKIFDKEFPADSFNKIIIGVAKVLLDKYPEKMRELATNMYNPWEGGERDCIHYTYDSNDKDQLIGENIRVHTNYSSVYCVQFATLLMEQFGIEPSQLIIYLKKDSVRTENIIPKKRRVEIVRNALSVLADENKVIYEPDNMPKSNDWIKFQTKELNDLFPYDELTMWDEEKFKSICYFEYNIRLNTIFMTYKVMKRTKQDVNVLKEHLDELGLNRNGNTGAYFWHIKDYKINYKEVAESTDKVATMKYLLEQQLIGIKEDLANMSRILR